MLIPEEGQWTVTVLNRGTSLVLSDLEEQDRLKIMQGLTLPNPLWTMLKRMGKTRALYAVKKDFKYYHKLPNGDLVVPRGIEERVFSYLSKRQIAVSIKDERKLPPIKRTKTTFSPREYQKEVFSSLPLLPPFGIIRCDTGFGKTLVALELARIASVKTLIVVPRVSLGEQFSLTLKEFYEETYRNSVTISTFQSLHKVQGEFGMVIVDEAHTAITDKRRKEIERFHPHFFYGLTATPERSDGQGKAIEFFFGPIIIDGKLPANPPKVIMAESGVHIMADEYANMVNEMAENVRRSSKIAERVLAERFAGRTVAVLTKRVAHYESIRNAILRIGPNAKIISFDAKAKPKDRKLQTEKIRDGSLKFEIVLGTYSMLSTGVDIPSLDTIFFAGDLKSSVLTAQASGRIRRIFEGKKSPLIVDVTDKSNATFKRQAACRKKFYSSQNWEIEEKHL